MKRLFDLTASLLLIILLSPFLLLISFWIMLDDGFPLIYRQKRVGLHNRDFVLYKFRTMRNASESKGLLTVGSRDPRITRSGYYLRKFKLDELPQLFNVLGGSMSMVGPRPEVRKYVDLYTVEQMKVLDAKPGITDYASLTYFSESDLLAASPDPESTYINEVMPAKLELNKRYIADAGLLTDLKIIGRTILRIFS